MSDGFPILTTKKVAFNTMVTELKWFLRGDTNIKYLVDNGCNIWNGDAYKNYRMKQVPHDHFETEDEFIELIKTNDRFAEKWGELGPIYGYQWRNKSRYGVQKDQIKLLMESLRNSPDSRRHLVNSWDVMELDDMVLPPCHYAFQCYVNGDKLDLMWHQRSADWFLGVPFNFASYGLLLSLLAYELKLKPGVLSASFGDSHIYSNHFEQMKEQIDRYPYYLPTIKINSSNLLEGEFDIKLEDYFYHPTIKGKLNT